MEEEKIILCANHGMFGGAANFCAAFTEHSEFDPFLFTHTKAPYNQSNGTIMTNLDKHHFKTYVIPLFEETKKFFIFDYKGLETLGDYLTLKTGRKVTHRFDDKNGILSIIQFLFDKEVTFFWSGTRYKNNHKTVNVWADTIGCKNRYAMLCLI